MNVNFIQEIVMTSARYDHLIKFAELCNSWAWALENHREQGIHDFHVTRPIPISRTVHWDLKVLGLVIMFSWIEHMFFLKIQMSSYFSRPLVLFLKLNMCFLSRLRNWYIIIYNYNFDLVINGIYEFSHCVWKFNRLFEQLMYMY